MKSVFFLKQNLHIFTIKPSVGQLLLFASQTVCKVTYWKFLTRKIFWKFPYLLFFFANHVYLALKTVELHVWNCDICSRMRSLYFLTQRHIAYYIAEDGPNNLRTKLLMNTRCVSDTLWPGVTRGYRVKVRMWSRLMLSWCCQWLKEYTYI